MSLFNSTNKAAVFAIAMGVCVAQTTFAQDEKRVYTGIRVGGSLGTSVLFKKSRLLDDYNNNRYYDYDKFDQKQLNGFHGTSGFIDIAPFVSLQLTDKFALQTEVFLTKFGYVGEKYAYWLAMEYVIPEDVGVEDFLDYKKEELKGKWVASRRALVIPLLVKYTLRADDKISFQLFAGPHFTANLGKWGSVDWSYYYMQKSPDLPTGWSLIEDGFPPLDDEMENNVHIPPFGFTVGTNFGFITKAGTFFLDVRFLGDIGAVKKNAMELMYYDVTELPVATGVVYHAKNIYRSKLSFSLGYEFGFGNR